ncbi:MAG: DNA-processing protein DprA [Patescibacteria group bacterium]
MESNDILRVSSAQYKDGCLSPLLELSDCPQDMYVRGKLPARDEYRYITIVGSRTHSAYAREALEYIIAELRGQSLCIISGLAFGIDALAHTLALKYGLATIAIPGSGLSSSVLYPASNQNLASSIIKSGGALLSEFTSDTKAARWTFPKRNRLMARLADVVLVVEASEQSGTLITARNAAEYGVDVGVIPASIMSETARGSNILLKQGAHPITSADDLLELLGITKIEQVRELRDDVGEDEKLILQALIEPLSRDELARKLIIEAHDLARLLPLLEIKGYIKEELGRISRV